MMADDTNNPCLVFARSVVKVRNRAKKERNKKRKIAPAKVGSRKQIKKAINIQRKIVTISVGKKFFRIPSPFFV
jgi:hypothetical protein